jgi:multidrug resistance protein, MATE family
MSIVDTIMVGKIGPDPIAAAALGSGFFNVVYVLGLGVSLGATPLVAIAVGARNTKSARAIFEQSFLLNMTCAVGMTLLVYFGADVMWYLNQPPAVVELAVGYTKWLAFSALPFMFFQTYRQFLEGFSIMRPAMIALLTANVVNVAVNYAFIYGNWGAPALGLNGAAIATFLSRLYAAFFLAFVAFRLDGMSRHRPSWRALSLDFPLVKKIFALGAPGGVQMFFEVFAFVAAGFMVGWIGAKELAAHSIALNVASVSFLAATGVAAAGSVRVGNAVGERNPVKTRRSGFAALGVAAGFMGFAAVGFLVFNRELVAVFVDDPETLRVAAALLLVAAAFQIFDGLQAAGMGVLRGLTDVKVPSYVAVVAYWAITLPVGYLMAFVFGWSVYGVWFGFVVGLVSVALTLAFRFNHLSKRADEIGAKHVEDEEPLREFLDDQAAPAPKIES